MSGYARVAARVTEAARRAARPPEEIRIVGAAKAQSVETVVAAVRAGLREIGHNYAQEAREKVPLVNERVEALGLPPPVWHFLGGLQTNKARTILPWCTCVQSVDRPSLARELNRRAGAAGRSLDVLVQVDVSGEASKGGVAPEELGALLAEREAWPHLRFIGLMAIPEPTADTDAMRPAFRALRDLRDRYRASEEDLRHLSMGMSADYETAISEGATIVRIGTAIFGPRRNSA